MTTFNLSQEAAREIRENLYRDHYKEPIEFQTADKTSQNGIHCYCVPQPKRGNKDIN